MAILKIIKYPHRYLKKPTALVKDFKDKQIHKLILDMAETMYDAPGIGLAANQVGVSLRVAIIDALWKSEDEKRDLRIFINPKILSKSDPLDFDEGCLSLPGITGNVKRFSKVSIEYQNQRGEKKKLDAEGLLAVALQHETDHLDGKLYIDYISSLKREFLLKKFKKLKSTK